MRAIRNRYLARSRPGRSVQDRRPARLAARTARSMSAAVAFETSASGSSVDGSMLVNVPPSDASTSRPSMNRPYRSRRVTTSRASGAGAYSHGIAWPSPRPQDAGATAAPRVTARSVLTPALLHRHLPVQASRRPNPPERPVTTPDLRRLPGRKEVRECIPGSSRSRRPSCSAPDLPRRLAPQAMSPWSWTSRPAGTMPASCWTTARSPAGARTSPAPSVPVTGTRASSRSWSTFPRRRPPWSRAATTPARCWSTARSHAGVGTGRPSSGRAATPSR